MEKILISISGYYERFQINTIESCIKRAKHPERLSFAIAHHEDHVVDTSHIPNRVSRFLIPTGDKIGVQKPKHILANMLNDEDYLLSIDSHVVMMPDWDEFLINDYLDRLEFAENKKIVISGNFGTSEKLGDLDYQYCLDTYFNNDEFFNKQEQNSLNEFLVDGDPKSVKSVRDYYETVLNKVPYLTYGSESKKSLANVYSGNFSFFPREWFNEYNFSKDMFFSADQPETAMNIYTSGYDIWAPQYKYHCHMTDHSSTAPGTVEIFEGNEIATNRYFDINKDFSGIKWFIKKINEGYNDYRPRSIQDFFDFHKLDKSKYK
jgi:hypothetical protein